MSKKTLLTNSSKRKIVIGHHKDQGFKSTKAKCIICNKDVFLNYGFYTDDVGKSVQVEDPKTFDVVFAQECLFELTKEVIQAMSMGTYKKDKDIDE